MPSIEELFKKYVDGSLTEAEMVQLQQLLREEGTMEALIDRQFQEGKEMDGMDPRVGEDMFERISGRMGSEGSSSHRFLFRWLAAACFIGAIGAAGLLWHERSHTPATNTLAARRDISPGGNRASLTLADGSVIDLDTTRSGLLVRQGNTDIRKQADGQIRYAAAKKSGDPVEINVLATPRGGWYKVTLSDGTSVTLNAASVLHYPTSFTGKDRTVTLEGEAYFDVAQDAKKPFFVKTKEMRVQVLGTRFDIMAYEEEPAVKATLLSGKISADSLLLGPGQQAVLYREDHRLTREPADTDEVIAWTEGLFLCSERMDVPTIMRQMERWYDVSVRYEGQVPAQTFYGGIQRSLPLSKVLSILEKAGIRCRVDGKEIVVLDSSSR